MLSLPSGRMFKVIFRKPEMEDVGASQDRQDEKDHEEHMQKQKAVNAADVEGGGSGSSAGSKVDGKAAIFACVEKTKRIGELSQVLGALELQHIAFAYPARPDVPIFKCV